MLIEIILTGTKAASIFSVLNEKLAVLGSKTHYQTEVPANYPEIVEALNTALSRAELIITVGGLGGTKKDFTREAIASAVGEELGYDMPTLQKIQNHYQQLKLRMLKGSKKQALFPKSARIIPNQKGTSAGFIVVKKKKILVALPDDTEEFTFMIESHVIPYLTKVIDENKAKTQDTEIKEDESTLAVKSRLVKTFGFKTEEINKEISELLKRRNPKIEVIPYAEEVHLRVTAKGKSTEEVEDIITETEIELREKLGLSIYGFNEVTLLEIVGKMLKNRKQTIAVAESCTGGLISHYLTNINGSSDYFTGALIPYQEQTKHKVLGIDKHLLEKKGAVSEEVAKEMAWRIRTLFNSAIGVGITGYAGPSGNPPGDTYIALAGSDDIPPVCYHYVFAGDRQTVKISVVQNTLNLIRLYLLGKK